MKQAPPPSAGRDDETASRFAIETSPSPQERAPRALKHGHTFAVFDARGDIVDRDGGSDGVYHRDTRHLSRLVLTLNGAPLLLLSSSIQADNAVLAVDLANPDLGSSRRPALRGELIHVNRLKFVWQNAVYERLLIRNYDVAPHQLVLGIAFAADFADLFEVRGTRRSRHGATTAERRDGFSVVLRHLGLDGIERATGVAFDPAPTRLDTAAAEFELALAPGAGVRLALRVGCGETDRPQPAAAGFYGALRLARRALRNSSGRAASLASTNTIFNEFARRSVADLYMLLTDTEHGPYPFAGIPWFSTVFGRDGIITALFTLWIDPEIARGVLNFLAATQASETDPGRDAEPGKIVHEMREGEMARLGEVPFARYYGSVDATPLFVMLLGEYVERTGDIATARALWPNVERALHWIDHEGDPDGDGFVEYARRNATGLVNQGWKDSRDAIFHADGSMARGPIALCEVQGWVYAAKRHAAQLAVALDHSAAAAILTRQAEALRENFERAFWCEELGIYALALDGDKRPCRVVTSNAGQVLFSGIAHPERARRVAETLLGVASFAGWGVRTLALTAPRYNPMSYHNGSIWPHDNALIALGLARYGLKEAVARIFEGLYAAAGYMELRRLPELFCGFPARPLTAPTLYPVACSPQAWASAAVFALVQASLGLSFAEAAQEIRFERPLLPRFLDDLQLRGLKLKEGAADVLLRRYGEEVAVTVTRREGDARIVVLH
ncbi:MAG TPA: amylo-alpha-1,6-glucosidase [Stellaceae bacterium]|nr:amylo-alpha-1,6-glucosidase [Stellaceae bacterium]